MPFGSLALTVAYLRMMCSDPMLQTATDGPDGYSVGSPSVIAPVLLDALADDPGLPYIAETLATLDARGIARTTMAYDMATGWQSDDVISIDVGSAALTRDAIARHGSLQ